MDSRGPTVSDRAVTGTHHTAAVGGDHMLAWLPILPIYVAARIGHEVCEWRARARRRDQAWTDAWNETWAHR